MNNLKLLVMDLSAEICKVIELIEEVESTAVESTAVESTAVESTAVESTAISSVDLTDAINTETIKISEPCVIKVPTDLITIINGKFVKLIAGKDYNISHSFNLYAPENITFEELEDLLLGGNAEDFTFKQSALQTPELYEVVIDKRLYKYNSAKFQELKKYGDRLNYIYIRKKN
jgi:hypothetical protein